MACYLDVDLTSGHSFQYDSDSSDSDENYKTTEPFRLLTETKVHISDLVTGTYWLIYKHPEALLDTKSGSKLLHNPQMRKLVCCLAIDEGHMIQEW